MFMGTQKEQSHWYGSFELRNKKIIFFIIHSYLGACNGIQQKKIVKL